MAATIKSPPGLKDRTSCTVCHNDFSGRDARSLPCQHAFCLQCIEQLLKMRRESGCLPNNVIRCPECRVDTQITGGSAKALPPFGFAEKMTKPATGSPAADKRGCCSICQKLTVCVYCLRCMKGMCLQCRVKHDRMQQNHPIVDANRSFMVHVMCDKHRQQVQSYCNKCKKAVCPSCQISDHCEHDVVVLIFDTNPDDQKKNFEQLKRVDDMKKHFNEEMEISKQQLLSHFNNTIEVLRKNFEELKLKLLMRQKAVNSELDKTKSAIQDDLAKRRPIKELPLARIDITEGTMDSHLTEPGRILFFPVTFNSIGVLEDFAPTHFKHVFADVSKIKGEVTSPKFYANTLPWSLIVTTEGVDNDKKLGMGVKCAGDTTKSDWTWDVDVCIKLLPQKTDVDPIKTDVHHVFNQKNPSTELYKVEWKTLVSDHLKDDSITVVVRFAEHK